MWTSTGPPDTSHVRGRERRGVGRHPGNERTETGVRVGSRDFDWDRRGETRSTTTASLKHTSVEGWPHPSRPEDLTSHPV